MDDGDISIRQENTCGVQERREMIDSVCVQFMNDASEDSLTFFRSNRSCNSAIASESLVTLLFGRSWKPRGLHDGPVISDNTTTMWRMGNAGALSGYYFTGAYVELCDALSSLRLKMVATVSKRMAAISTRAVQTIQSCASTTYQ